ncbi:hypothetical protein [Arthrobacter yangruifuii]|uniref:hypothetical protein n=1 Tax=Arthrobacter yangruifuii TaxID=2606616 RepID=UPI0011B38E77|nr:hypothetical protein [Arthrobacter yangruifuii]
MQQLPLYVRVRSVLEIVCTLWLIFAVVGVGFFSGGTTSLALSLILLYGTGAALLVVIAALYRILTKAALQRVEAVPDDNAAAVFVDTTRSATEEIMAALRPATPRGRSIASVRMPQTVNAVDVAAALAARTAAHTSAAAAEKSAVAGSKTASVSPTGKSASSKPAGKKPATAGKSASKGTSAGEDSQSKSGGASGESAQGLSATAKKPASVKKSAGAKKPAGVKKPAEGADSAAGKAARVAAARHLAAA